MSRWGADLQVDGGVEADRADVRNLAVLGQRRDRRRRQRHADQPARGRQAGQQRQPGRPVPELEQRQGRARWAAVNPRTCTFRATRCRPGRIAVKTSAPAFDVHVNGTVCAVDLLQPVGPSAQVRRYRPGRYVVDRLAQSAGRDLPAGRAAIRARHPSDDRPEWWRRRCSTAFPELVIPMGPGTA